MKYSYTALSTDNQKLTGILDAGSIEAAQEELHKMGLSIISINEISEEESETQKAVKAAEKAEGIRTFVFEAFDRGGKEINGTIDAADDYSAYKRLMTEYKFKVNSLYLIDASDSEKAQSKEKIAEFSTMMEEEGIYVSTEEEREKADFEETVEKIDKKVVEEIDQFIINVKKILDEHSANFSSPFLRQIENTLGELERVRTSTNLKHISEVCNQLYELISNPDQAETAGETSGVGYQSILDSMKGTSLIRGDFDIHAKAIGFSQIQNLFKKIIKKLTGRELIVQKKETTAGKLLNKLLTKKIKPKVSKAKPKAAEKPGFTNIIKKFFSYIGAPNAILRKTRKQELLRAYIDWRKPKIKEKPVTVKKPAMKPTEEPLLKAEKPSRWDFTGFFTETDSFISWLLFFYILFFFLVDFSLEKDMGLPRDFVVKTLKTPLILNITIFLIFAHCIFKLKTQYFRHNLLGSLFLIFFGFGLYALLVINF